MLPATTQMKLNVVSGRAFVPRKCAAPQQRAAVLMRAKHAVEDISEAFNSEKKEKKSKKYDDEFEGDDALSPQQVQALLDVLCQETEIAEVELKMGGFKMKVRRSLSGLAGVAPAVPVAAAAAPVAAAAPAEYAPAPASAHSDPESSFDEDDGSIVIIPAPKVGILRRGRFLKGKQVGKANTVEVGATVKKGQVLAYIEQLGTHWPVESPQAGELASFVVEDGDAVEYHQPVIEISPFFGGHIIGDSKYA